jgi:hypothetical protein
MGKTHLLMDIAGRVVGTTVLELFGHHPKFLLLDWGMFIDYPSYAAHVVFPISFNNIAMKQGFS